MSAMVTVYAWKQVNISYNRGRSRIFGREGLIQGTSLLGGDVELGSVGGISPGNFLEIDAI